MKVLLLFQSTQPVLVFSFCNYISDATIFSRRRAVRITFRECLWVGVTDATQWHWGKI